MNKNAFKSNILLLICSVIWGLAFVFQSEAMNHITPLFFTAFRCFLGAVILAPVYFLFRIKNKGRLASDERKKQNRVSVIVGIVCGIILYFAITFQQIGLKYTPAGKAGFITALYIVLVPILNSIVFKSKAGILTYISVAFATTGLYLLCVKEGFSIGTGDIWVICCAVIFSVQILIVDRFSAKIDGVLVALIQFTAVTVIAFPVALLFEDIPSWSAVRTAGVAIIYTGIFSSGVAFTLQIIGQQCAKNPTIASLLMSMESVFAAVFGWLILHERLLPQEKIGVGLMICAIVLAQLPPFKKKNRAAVPSKNK